GAREDAPRLVLDGDLAALPGSASDLHRCLVEGELVGPGGEATPAAVVVEPLQHGEERIVGRLLRDLVQITAEVRMRGTPPPRLETRCPQEQCVETLDRVVDDPARAQVAKPRARFVVEGGPAVLLDRGGSPGGALHARHDRRPRAHAACRGSSSGARMRAAREGGQPRSTSSIRAWRSYRVSRASRRASPRGNPASTRRPVRHSSVDGGDCRPSIPRSWWTCGMPFPSGPARRTAPGTGG